MIKYLELVEGSFTQEHFDKQLNQDPYVAYSIQDDKVIYNIVPTEDGDAHTYVDLGLSVKWADRNVGAENPWDNGLYFSWGNVDGHAVENGNVAAGYSFDRDTYATTSGGQYTGSTLDAEHDAATANMGSDWRMPTMTETIELVENTDQYYIDLSGNTVAESELDGSNLRSICFVKKGEEFNYDTRSNFIEIPFAGAYISTLLYFEGSHGVVWSSSVDDGNVYTAQILNFDNTGFILYGDTNQFRYSGQPVRGVRA
jgi:hypothetical protein